jgi:glycosyltransferase involved in cell wall biosynthesis
MDKSIDNNEIFLSIILPVYNVEKFLNRCIDSVLQQNVTFKYEIIAVDDCSTDNSFAILEEYQANYNFFKIIKHETNKSLSVARKTGINASEGKYIMNVDSDDWIEENSLQKIYTIINNDNSDIFVFNYSVDDSINLRKKVKLIHSVRNYSNKNYIHRFFLGAPWNKIVKRELLNDIFYGEIGINNGEDLVFATEIFLKTNKISTNKFSFYIYFKNLSSLSRIINSDNFLKNQILVLDQLTKIFDKYSPSEKKVKFILNYFIKFIFNEIYNYHYNNTSNSSNLLYFSELNNNPYIIKYYKNQIITSTKSKQKLIYYLFKYTGIKNTIIKILKTILYVK